jgi:hypothetical protein
MAYKLPINTTGFFTSLHVSYGSFSTRSQESLAPIHDANHSPSPVSLFVAQYTSNWYRPPDWMAARSKSGSYYFGGCGSGYFAWQSGCGWCGTSLVWRRLEYIGGFLWVLYGPSLNSIHRVVLRKRNVSLACTKEGLPCQWCSLHAFSTIYKHHST